MGVLFNLRYKAAVHSKLSQTYGPLKIASVMYLLDSQQISDIVSGTPGAQVAVDAIENPTPKQGEPELKATLGDGTILTEVFTALGNFLKSPLGQQLEAIGVQFLIAAITGA